MLVFLILRFKELKGFAQGIQRMLSRTGAPVTLTLAAGRTAAGKADHTALDLEQELR